MADDRRRVFLNKIGFAGVDEQNALRQALYNTALIGLLLLCIVGLLALYNLMYMFLLPMLWAVLVGTILFPFKRKLTAILRDWLSSLQEAHTPLLVGLAFLPVQWVIILSDNVYATATGPQGIPLLCAYGVLKLLCYENTFMYVLKLLGRLHGALDAIILFTSRPWVFPLISVYFAGYAAFVYLQHQTINKKLARTLSLPIWLYVLSVVAQWAGPFRVAVFGGSAIALALISAGIIRAEEEENGEKREETPTEERLPLTGHDLVRAVMALVFVLVLARHDVLLLLVLLPLLLAMVRHVSTWTGTVGVLLDHAHNGWTAVQPTVRRIVDISIAGPLRKFVRVLFTSDQLLVSSLHDKMDMFSSILVMFLLALSLLSGVFFVVFQLHQETVHLVRLASNVMSSHPDFISTALNYTGDKLEDNNIDIDRYVHQAYEQGRAFIAGRVRDLAGNDPMRADQLEQHVNEVLDRIYGLWEERNSVRGNEVVAEGRADWLSQLTSVTDIGALREEITLIVKENVDTLIGIAQSVWSVLVVNISVLSSLFSAVIGLIFNLGMDMLNVLIEFVVFLSMVYYLLASSAESYFPLQLFSHLPASSGTFVKAVEDSIFGVFGLSCNMAVFYGLYTYLIHSLFDLNIVFVPSLFAAIFGAIPIMSPWMVCIFGVIELFLVEGNGTASLVFFVLSISPLFVADTKFYSEVKGVHPYVTGLSVIGGMYWLGLQGAIIGPLVLCVFLVLIKVCVQLVS